MKIHAGALLDICEMVKGLIRVESNRQAGHIMKKLRGTLFGVMLTTTSFTILCDSYLPSEHMKC